MDVYQTDENGFYVGTVKAPPSPLEPDQYLVPRGAVEVAPPALSDGQKAQWAGGAWVVVDPEPAPEPEPEPTPEEQLAAERAGMVASAMQIRLALLEIDRLSEVEAIVSGSTLQVQIAWDKATEFRRNSPTIASLAPQADPPFTDDQIDDLFRAAMEIEA